MPYIIIILILIIGGSSAIAQPYSSIQYQIETTLQKPSFDIVEHTSVEFCLDSSVSEPLRFWRLQFDHPDDAAIIDSIKVNDSIVSIPEDFPFFEFSAENSRKSGEDVLFTLPRADLLIAGSMNRIQFYYRIILSKKSPQKALIPDGSVYCEYYPRLALTSDSLLGPKQRAEEYCNYSLRITLPSDLALLSETCPDDSIYGEGVTTYTFSRYDALLVTWMAAPRISCRRMILADSMETFVYVKPLMKMDSAAIAEIDSSLRYYENIFGEMPYERLNVLFTDLPSELAGGALQNFMLFRVQAGNGGIIERIFYPVADMFQNNIFLAHETAHLWWGGGVYFSDDWPAEAMATYWSKEYLATRGKGEYNTTPEMLDRLFYRLDEAYREGKAIEASYANYYVRGPYILRMLFNDIGKERTAELCRAFYSLHNRCGANTVDSLRRFLSDSIGHEADRYWALWLDSGYSQNYAIADVQSNISDGQYENRLRLTRTGKAYSSVIARLRYADGSIEDRRIHPDSLYLAWTSPHSLNSVMLDPGFKILETMRSDNGWLVRPKLYLPSINPAATYLKWIVFSSTDEPAYHIWVSPQLPSHSDRFGWTMSTSLSGKRSSWFLDKERGRYLVDATVGYNERTRGVVYSGQFANGIKRSRHWGAFYKIGTERMDGCHDTRLTLAYNRWADSWGNNWFVCSLSAGRREYYGLRDVAVQYWPEIHTCPVTLDAAFFGANSNWPLLRNFKFRLSLEKGLALASADDHYSKGLAEINMSSGIVEDLRLFAGKLSGVAVQEQFDPAVEGMINSCPPFVHRSNQMAGVRLLIDSPVNSFITPRIFMAATSLQNNATPFAECGIGLLLGQSNFGIIIDMPCYINRTDYDPRHWSLQRARIQLRIFNSGNSPQLDFRIK